MTEIESEELKLDWNDDEQVHRAMDRARKRYPHLADCVTSGGRKCPACGSAHVSEPRSKKLHNRTMHSYHCNGCGTGYTQYIVDPDHDEKWGPTWHAGVISLQVEGFPYYIYFKPGTHILEGIGPDVLPWVM